MKVASRIHPKRSRKPSRTVTVFGVAYEFVRSQGKGGEDHYVADVDDEHVDLLIASGNYYKFTGAPAPAAKLTRTARTAGPAPADEDADDKDDGAGDNAAEAGQLLTGSATEISKAVGAVSSIAVVEAALQIERDGKKPRKSVVQLLESAIEGAKQAGVHS